MLDRKQQEPTVITSKVVDGIERLEFLPKYFGLNLAIVAESVIYNFAEKLIDNYCGGYWHFHALSNGGFYVSLDESELLKLEVNGNYFSGEMSADAAGIVITLFVLGYLAEAYQAPYLVDAYHSLSDFIPQHEECSLIYQAID